MPSCNLLILFLPIFWGIITMCRNTLFSITAIGVLCLLSHSVMAQDVMVKPSDSSAAGQNNPSWFSIFTPSKNNAPQPGNGPQPPTRDAGQKEKSVSPSADVSKLPPDIQKEYHQAIRKLEEQKFDPLNAGKLPKGVDATKIGEPSFPDIKGLNLPEDLKEEYIKKTEKLSEMRNNQKRKTENLQPLEYTLPPEPSRNLDDHKYQHQLNVILTQGVGFTAGDITTISDYFGITKESVQELCDFRLGARAEAKDGHGDFGEEFRNGSAVTFYDGSSPNVQFEASARCRLNKLPENVLLRIKDRENKYLYRLGTSACQAPEGVTAPTSVKVEYLGGGQVSCHF